MREAATASEGIRGAIKLKCNYADDRTRYTTMTEDEQKLYCHLHDVRNYDWAQEPIVGDQVYITWSRYLGSHDYHVHRPSSACRAPLGKTVETPRRPSYFRRRGDVTLGLNADFTQTTFELQNGEMRGICMIDTNDGTVHWENFLAFGRRGFTEHVHVVQKLRRRGNLLSMSLLRHVQRGGPVC